MSLSVGYVGSDSSHVVAFRDYNQALPGVGDPSTWAPYQDRRRLAPDGITGAVRYTSSDAVANYNGLQVSMRRRRANGFEFLASYTLSKSLGRQPRLLRSRLGRLQRQLAQHRPRRGRQLQLVRHDARLRPALVLLQAQPHRSPGTYELPIGKGRKIGSNWSGVTQALLGGWNVSSILTVRSGLPGTTVAGWGPGSSLQNSGFSFERPDRVEGVDPQTGNGGWDNYLNLAAFKPAALGTFGNSGIGIWTGPGYWNVDFSLDKNVRARRVEDPHLPDGGLQRCSTTPTRACRCATSRTRRSSARS